MGADSLVPTIRLEVRDLTVRALTSKQIILDGISFTLEARECVAVVGESGAGKTMLGRCLAGVLPESVAMTSGKVQVSVEPFQSVRNKVICPSTQLITMVPQIAASSLPPLVTAFTFVKDVWRWNSLEDPELEMIYGLFEKVGIPRASVAIFQRPHELSGGTARRVALAAALASRASLLILDEPTIGLDPLARWGILELLRSLHRGQGIAMLLVTHDIEFAASLCSRFIALRLGRMIAAGNPWSLAQAQDRYLRELLTPLCRRARASDSINA
jgi:peptide/nickel transport system ATP-binding protein